MPVDLSVVLPSYLSADVARQHIPALLAHLRSSGVSHEVIVVDDGSGDDGATERVAADLGCRYIELSTNQGKGASVRRGILAAEGRYRIYTDVDVPYQLSAIDSILHYLDVEHFDFVTGDRTLAEASYYAHMPPLRRIASHVYSALVSRLIAGERFDTQCGLKGFRAEVAKQLFSAGRVNRFAFDVELFCIAREHNLRIKRLPVQLRCHDTSTVNVVSDGLTMLRDLARIRGNQLRGHYRRRLTTGES